MINNNDGARFSRDEAEINGNLKGVCLRFIDAQGWGLLSENESETPMVQDYNVDAEKKFL